MDDDIKQIYYKIINDPDLLEDLVNGYVGKHPEFSPEEFHLYILNLIADEYSREADEEKKRKQIHIARGRVISKVLKDLPDNDSPSTTKSQLKEAVTDVSDSAYEREILADKLKDYCKVHFSKKKKKITASDDIKRELQNDG